MHCVCWLRLEYNCKDKDNRLQKVSFSKLNSYGRPKHKAMLIVSPAQVKGHQATVGGVAIRHHTQSAAGVRCLQIQTEGVLVLWVTKHAELQVTHIHSRAKVEHLPTVACIHCKNTFLCNMLQGCSVP